MKKKVRFDVRMKKFLSHWKHFLIKLTLTTRKTQKTGTSLSINFIWNIFITSLLLFFSNLPPPSITFHHLSPPSTTFHHLPPPSFSHHHLQPPSTTFHHLPSHTTTFNHLPPPSTTFHCFSQPPTST